MHSQHIGQEMHQVIANAIINRDLDQSEREWAVCKKESLEMLSNVDKAVETPQERANARKAEWEYSACGSVYFSSEER